jgi:hypothetical protein
MRFAGTLSPIGVTATQLEVERFIEQYRRTKVKEPARV